MKYLILFTLFAHSYAQAEPCSFPNDKGLLSIEKCADISIKIDKKALSQFKFDSNGLAGGSIGTLGCYWLKKSGEIKKTHCYDNGADAFADGLTRYVDDKGYFGYMDTKLKIVIKPKFTFGFPFANGAAWVCNDCKTVQEKDSEHSRVEGGSWFVINKKGEVTKSCSKAFDYQSCNNKKK